MEELIKTKLIELAKQRATYDEENFSAGIFSDDVDNAYDMGCEDGKIRLAREILEIFCIRY